MSAGDVGFTVGGTESQCDLGPDDGAEEGDVIIVGVEDVLHGPASQPDRIFQVGCVDVLKFRHGSYPGGYGPIDRQTV